MVFWRLLARTLTAVLFDWDGTLCDSGAAHFDAFRKTLADFGIAITRDRFNAVYTPAWYRMYEAFGLPRAKWPLADQCWLRHYGEQTCDLLPGAAAAVASLNAAGMRLGIVSGGNRSRIERELACGGLSAVFPALVCHEDVVEKKPHPEGVLKALAALATAPANCCFVGDTPEDVAMGRAAGVATVAVVTEFVERGRLEASAPDELLDSIEELPSLLLG